MIDRLHCPWYGRRMLVLGFDIGLDSIAVAGASQGRVVFCRTITRSHTRRIKGKTVRDFDPAYFVRLKRIAKLARTYDAHVYVEQSYGALNLRTFKALSHVEAEVRYEFARWGVIVEYVAASTWQSAMLHKTRPRTLLEQLSKQEALKHTRGAKERPTTPHECDAVNIARYGCTHKHEKETSCSPPHKQKQKSSRKSR